MPEPTTQDSLPAGTMPGASTLQGVPQGIQPEIEVEPTYKCSCCSCVETESDSEKHDTIDGDVCDDCFNDDYFYCDQCSEYYHNDNLLCIDDICYCSRDCANNAGYYTCADCRDWYHTDDGSINSAGDGICSSCADNYYCCDNCSDVVHSDDVHHNNSGNYCSSCWEDDADRVIHDYSYKPSSYVYSKMEYENTVYLGIELEVEAGRASTNDKAEAVMQWLVNKRLDHMVYIKEDSSLDNGFEIVWHPITLKALHKKFPMRQFLAYLQELKLTSHKGGSCGLHVHVSRGKMKEADIYRGKIFFYKCASYLKTFSARRDGKSDLSDDSIFSYCKFDESMPSSAQNTEYGRYCVLNTCNTKTIEVRLFRGTLIYNRFQASVQFSDAIAEYIQVIGTEYLKRASSAVIWHGFIDYCKRSCKYSQFIKYVLKKGII